MYTTRVCGYCIRAKQFLDRKHIPYEEIDVTVDQEQREWLLNVTGMRTVPQIFINDQPIGGYHELVALDLRGELDALLGT